MTAPYRSLFIRSDIPRRPLKDPLLIGLIEKPPARTGIDFDAFVTALLNAADVVERATWMSDEARRCHRLTLERGEKTINYEFSDEELCLLVHPFHAIITKFFQLEWDLLDDQEKEALAKEWTEPAACPGPHCTRPGCSCVCHEKKP